MKVLHVVHTLDPSGAGSVEAARLYSLLSGPNCEIEVLSLDHNVTPWQANWPVPVHCAGKAFSAYRYSPSLVRWLRDQAPRFDAVVVHGIWHYHLLAVWCALRFGPVPYFVVLHGMLNPWFRRTYPFKHLKKTIFWHAAVHRAIADAAAVLFLCEEERRLAGETFNLNLRGEALVPLGTCVEPVSPELFFDQFPDLRSKRLLLFLGRVCFMKGCDLLLDSFAGVAQRYPDTHLVVCGPDEEQWQRDLIRRASHLGLRGRVTWAGPLYGDMKWSALNASDLLVLPSRCETFPITVLEALACGLPVLITEEVNIWPAVREASAGFVCRPTTDSVHEAMDKWLAMGSSERSVYREHALQCFTRNYELQSAFAKHVDALRVHMSKTPITEVKDKDLQDVRA